MNVFTRKNVVKKLQQRFPELFKQDRMYELIEIWKWIYMDVPNKHTSQIYKWNVHDKRHLCDIMTLNVAKIACEELRTLSFSEGVELNINDDKWEEYFKNVFEKEDFWNRLGDNVEQSFYALGGMACQPYAKESKDGTVTLGYKFTEADLIIPLSWEDEEVTEMVFVKIFTKKRKRYMHLQIHEETETGIAVTNELYLADDSGVFSTQVDFNEIFPGVEEAVDIAGIDAIIPVYAKPAVANNKVNDVPQGISIFGNSIDTIASINLVYDVWYSEFKNGRKRILVPEWALKTVMDPVTKERVRYFDPYDESYQAFNQDLENNTFEDFTSEIRSTDIIASIQAYLNIFAMELGLTPGIFTFSAESGAITATEVISKNSKTFKTKKKHERNLDTFIREVIKSSFVVIEGFNIPDTPAIPNMDKLTIEAIFDDSIIVDDAKEREEARTEVQDGLLPKVKYWEDYRGLNEEQIKEYQELLAAENEVDFGEDLLTPTDGESEEDFIARFMADEDMQIDYPEEEARRAKASQVYATETGGS